MRKNSIRERAQRNSPSVKRDVRRSMAIASLIFDILETKGISQKEFAERLGKKESQISKWLRGTHNFTLRTIGNIEDALGVTLIQTADETKQEIYLSLIHSEGEQSVLQYSSSGKFKYTDVKKGKTFEVQVSIATQNNVIELDECQAN